MDPVECVETHVSKVFIGPDRVFKLKRAVVFPYLDFSTPEKRREACEAEIRINKRTAPTIYQGVVAITRQDDGTLALGGEGETVDWVVDMRRFDQDTLFDRMARAGTLTRAMVEDLADRIADFHGKAEVNMEAGGSAGIGMIIKNNDKCFGKLDRQETRRLTRLSLDALDGLTGLLDRRRDLDRVRLCHGDLHLRNICMVDGTPTLFDAIEFNDAFSTIDVLYDLAFVLMDLNHLGLGRLANILFNRYFDNTGEGEEHLDGLRVMALFLSMRAAIRAHVDISQAESLSDVAQAKRRAGEAADYLHSAISVMTPPSPRLIAVGGLSGSGKSRMARELAPHIGSAGAALGARVVRSDSTRKRLAGVAWTARLGAEGYTPEMTERTFTALYDEVRNALRAGFPVIADAVFSNPEQRKEVAEIAKAEGVPFAGLWLEAPPDVMARRVTERTRNVSDADAEIVKMQQAYNLGQIDWAKIDSAGDRDDTLRAGLKIIGG
ncbi:MAG: AAA family ATPase [Alphaproteobacteria bacterium]|nr:AAA family ATPase [Alphaproteobacteria bacterium]